MKKGLAVAMAALLGVATMGTTAMAAASGDITICSREDGSGTRGAFIELFGIEEKDADGNKVDNTTEAAKITNSTSVMLSTVAQDVNAIGYVSLGSLDDSVTALKIDGAEATAENIESGDYKVVRPFNIATKDDVSEAVKNKSGNVSHRTLLPSEKAICNLDKEEISVMKINTMYETAWMDGKLMFKDTPLPEALKKLSYYYNVEFVIQDAEIKSYCLTGILDNRLLSQTLDYLRISSNIDYRIEDMKTDDSKGTNRIL